MNRSYGILAILIKIFRTLHIDYPAYYFYVFVFQRFFPGRDMKKELKYYDIHKDEISDVIDHLADDKSKSIYKALLEFRSRRTVSLRQYRSKNSQYFEKDFLSLQGESFVDCGAYDGDTISSFLGYDKEYEYIYAFEPDKENYRKLCEYLERNHIRCNSYNMGVSEKKEVLYFSDSYGTPTTQISKKGGVAVEVADLSSILRGKRITFIKMDIEGAETVALKGAKDIIYTQRPILAICIYHSKEDMIQIPKMLMEWLSDYSFYIRHYTDDWSETVFYAVPNERSVITRENS